MSIALPAAGRPHRYALLTELLLLFFGLPGIFLLDLSRTVTAALLIAALGYVAVVAVRTRAIPAAAFRIPTVESIRRIFPLFLVFALLSTVAVAVYDEGMLFRVVRERPRLWALMLFIYCVFSVYPQTLIFRAFFLERYAPLFSRTWHLVCVNAVAFSWAHSIIPHPLVYTLTLVGAVVFSRTYFRDRTVLTVAVEHALYGFWLFTVGLGEYFAFPGA